jgi:hypothetical protein
MKLEKNLKAPLLILSIGLAIIGGSFVVAYWYKWTPVSFPVDLRQGITRSPPFSVNLTDNYAIEIEVERTLPFKQLNCLLGIGETTYEIEMCQAIPSPVEYKWWVFSPSGELIAQGTSAQKHSNGRTSARIMSRVIGEFQAEAGNEYVVQVESLKDASVLASTNPHIKVQSHTTAQKSHYVVSGIVRVIGLMFAIPGIIWLAVRMFASRARVVNE